MAYVSPRHVLILIFLVLAAVNLGLLSPSTHSFLSDKWQDLQRTSTLFTFSADHNFTRISPNTTYPDDRDAPIVFALVMFGQDSAREGLLPLKTALMHVSRPTEFHIVCSDDAVPVITDKLALFSRPSYPVTFRFYPITQPEIVARAARAGVGSSYEAGAGGLVKTFLHELLYDVDRAIFVDTDMLFLVDPALLWREFAALDDNQIVAFPTLGPKSHSGWICTCVMLLNLKVMRERMFMPSTLLPNRSAHALGSADVWRKTKTDPYKPDYGDQGLYWAILQIYPQYFKHLSISWDTTHCRYSYGMSLADGDDSMPEESQVSRQWDTQEAPERFKQLFPAILHFNCQNTPVVWDDHLNAERTRWGPFVSIAVQYKWIWLNRGDGSAGVDAKIVDAPRFWDEVLSEAGGDSQESEPEDAKETPVADEPGEVKAASGLRAHKAHKLPNLQSWRR